MLNKTILILVWMFGVSAIHSQDLVCNIMQDRTCVAVSVFSVDNIQQIRTYGGADSPSVLKAIWHDTDPTIVMLDNSYNNDKSKANRLLYWKFEKIDDIELPIFKGVLAEDKSFNQLALKSNTIAVGTGTGSVMFWNLAQESFLYEIPISEGVVTELLFHPSGEWLLAIIDHSKAYQIDMESRSLIEIKLALTDQQVITALTFSEDGRLLAFAVDTSLQIWETESWSLQAESSVSANSIQDLQFILDDTQLIILADATVSRWSLTDNELNLVTEMEAYPSKKPCLMRNGDISPDGSLLMTTDDCEQLRAWDISLDTEIFVPQLDSSQDIPWEILQFSPDGRYLLNASSSGWVLFFIYPS